MTKKGRPVTGAKSKIQVTLSYQERRALESMIRKKEAESLAHASRVLMREALAARAT